MRVADGRASAGKTFELYNGTHFVKFTREWLESQMTWLRESLEDDHDKDALRQLPVTESVFYNSLLKDNSYQIGRAHV